MPARAVAPVILALLVGFFACLLCAKPAMTLPTLQEGFTDDLVTGAPLPTALAFTPDDRMLVASKSGQLWVFKDGKLLQTPALDIGSKVCANSERGLLGVAVDPDFETAGSNYVYLYYTYKKHGVCPDQEPGSNDNPVNRVSRFVMSGDTLESEEVLIDDIPSPNGNHNAGDLHFGKDNNLYVSVGDGGCDYAEPRRCQYENDASRDRHILLGKVLRITREGGIPPDNPYTGLDSERCGVTGANGRTDPGNDCQETFALGFRNPFRLAFDPDAVGTSFRINDVGGQRWEEIDEAEIGADYGWNLCEGRHDNPDRGGKVNCSGQVYTGPIHEYHHRTGCESITGGAFVPDDGSWPDPYDDAYLFGDFVCHKIFMLSPREDGRGFTRQRFAGRLGRGGPIAMAFNPYETDKPLYYTTFARGGEVHRITHTGGG